jgi:beta-glucanase (GH16 family)
MIGTQKTFEKKFGYFEARIKFQRSQGHHGAFWLQSANYGKAMDDPATCGAEIDIVEFFGRGRPDGGVSCTVFWNPYPNPKTAALKVDVIRGLSANWQPGLPRPEICDDFHLFSLLWTADGYRYFIDGVEVCSTADGLSKCEQYVILSLESKEWERSRLDPMNLPDTMMVDYVRVYDRIKPAGKP